MIEEKTIEKEININPLIELFEPVNPHFDLIYKNKTQRGNLEYLVKKYGYEKVENMLREMPDILREDKFFGDHGITTPLELVKKLPKLIDAKYRVEADRKKKLPKKYKSDEYDFKPFTKEEIEFAQRKLQEIRESLSFLRKK